MPWDPVVVREALLREHYRGGQSFFVAPAHRRPCPTSSSILREEVPEVRAVTAHGQMAPTEVEERMSAFYDRKYDVLLSTTIVESGLDIPTRQHADHPPRRPLRPRPALPAARPRRPGQDPRLCLFHHARRPACVTEAADKRLKVLANLESLGAGFQLASHDLDIRGAGNLLGDEQSGHIKEVGFELYQSMLEEAILEAKAGGIASARRATSRRRSRSTRRS